MKTALPIYHQAMDWDAFLQRYPVADVFVDTVYKWSPDRIRALQNERFLEVMEVGWKNPFYQRLWKKAGIEPGDIRSLDDITKLPIYNSEDVKADQQEHPPFGVLDRILELRRALVAHTNQARDQWRHDGEAADHVARHRRMGVERTRRLAHAFHARRAAGRRSADPSNLLARQSRLGDGQGHTGISRRPAPDHRQRRGDAEPSSARDCL